MSKDRFDRLDEDLFDKPAAPPVGRDEKSRFDRDPMDVARAVEPVLEAMQMYGVTVDPAIAANIRARDTAREQMFGRRDVTPEDRAAIDAATSRAVARDQSRAFNEAHTPEERARRMQMLAATQGQTRETAAAERARRRGEPGSTIDPIRALMEYEETRNRDRVYGIGSDTPIANFERQVAIESAGINPEPNLMDEFLGQYGSEDRVRNRPPGYVGIGEPHQVLEDPGPPEMPNDPRGWYFHVGAELQDDGPEVYVVFTPIHYWRMNRAQIDTHVSEAIGHVIPPYLSEETESTFSLVPNAEAITAQMIADDLVARGFQSDPQFDAHFNRSQEQAPTMFLTPRPEDWIFAITEGEGGQRYVSFVPGMYWSRHQRQASTRVTRWINESLPHWVHGERDGVDGTFFIDAETAPADEQAIRRELEAIGFVYSNDFTHMVDDQPRP